MNFIIPALATFVFASINPRIALPENVPPSPEVLAARQAEQEFLEKALAAYLVAEPDQVLIQRDSSQWERLLTESTSPANSLAIAFLLVQLDIALFDISVPEHDRRTRAIRLMKVAAACYSRSSAEVDLIEVDSGPKHYSEIDLSKLSMSYPAINGRLIIPEDSHEDFAIYSAAVADMQSRRSRLRYRSSLELRLELTLSRLRLAAQRIYRHSDIIVQDQLRASLESSVLRDLIELPASTAVSPE